MFLETLCLACNDNVGRQYVLQTFLPSFQMKIDVSKYKQIHDSQCFLLFDISLYRNILTSWRFELALKGQQMYGIPLHTFCTFY